MPRDFRTVVCAGSRHSDTVIILRRVSLLQAYSRSRFGTCSPEQCQNTLFNGTLECPYCAQFQKFLDRDFLPKYASEVRFIFKEFPLSKHPWPMAAAFANECAYTIDSGSFARFRSLIFDQSG
jgi:hypothetical protein